MFARIITLDTHFDDINTYRMVIASPTGIEEVLFEYVSEWWPYFLPTEDMPTNKSLAIKTFFDKTELTYENPIRRNYCRYTISAEYEVIE